MINYAIIAKNFIIYTKIFKNLTQSRKERQEKYGVTTLRALRLRVGN